MPLEVIYPGSPLAPPFAKLIIQHDEAGGTHLREVLYFSGELTRCPRQPLAFIAGFRELAEAQ